MSEYKIESFDKSEVDSLLRMWEPHLDSQKFFTITSELAIDRPLHVVKAMSDEEILVVFDVIPARDQNKTLKIFFNPKFAVNNGLTVDKINEIKELLVFIFLSLVDKAAQHDRVNGVKIHSDDDILLAVFHGFAEHLAEKGICSVKGHGNWIIVSDLK